MISYTNAVKTLFTIIHTGKLIYNDPAPAKRDTAMTAAISAKLLAPCSTLPPAPVAEAVEDAELEVPVLDSDPAGVPLVPGPCAVEPAV
jgi:hypothetical protein